MKNLLKASLILLASIAILASCSPYEENGLISKKPSKAIVGEWTLSSLSESSIDMYSYEGSSTTTTSSTTYSGSLMTEVEDGETTTYSYTQKVTFNEDGTCTTTTTADGGTYTSTSTFTFLSGSSDNELLSMDGENYVIKKLTKSELIIELNESSSSASDGYTSSSTDTFSATFTK